MQKFCEVIEEVREIHEIYEYIIPIELTKEDNEKFQKLKNCHICNKKLNRKNCIQERSDS